MPTPGMLETTSKVTPQPGIVLLVDILLKKFWAKPCLNKNKYVEIDMKSLFKISLFKCIWFLGTKNIWHSCMLSFINGKKV